MRCLANQLRLKELYGTGFKIFSNFLEENTETVANFLESILPTGWKKIESYATQISYEFPASTGALSKVFASVEANTTKYGILNWGIGQTTLEEVFVKLISEADASASY